MSRALEARKRPQDDSSRHISQKVISRLRWYLTALDNLALDGQQSVSSWQLAEKVGVSAALIRKDLSRFGDFGTPSYGYRIEPLEAEIRAILGLDQSRGMVWIGAYALRYCLGELDRLTRNRCRIIGAFDSDPDEIGKRIGDIEVQNLSELRDSLSGQTVSAGVVAIAGADAQDAASTLVEMGAKAILNMSGGLLVLPDQVRVCSVDIIGELLELCFYCGETG